MTKHYFKLMLRAFNGEADAAILKVRWDNINTMRERIKKAFEAINKLGETHVILISNTYLNLWLEELDLTFEQEEKLQEEKEEQRRIREQIREEEKVQQELEKAKKEAEDDESRYKEALEKAKAETEKAKGEELRGLNEKIVLLEKDLSEAQARKERVISRAQLTKAGNVYIISNIGSFGQNIFKIGMTRREEPKDRIKELGDASVPFEFDIHAMIPSDNAPELENILQAHFESKRVNMVNPRKEFFNVLIDDIEQVCREKQLNIKLTKLAEARQYRETLLKRQITEAGSRGTS